MRVCMVRAADGFHVYLLRRLGCGCWLAWLLVCNAGLICALHTHAGIAADNTFVDCMNYTLPPAQRTNCTKVWHHSWVHDCREKGVRGDDFNLNLTSESSSCRLKFWNCS